MGADGHLLMMRESDWQHCPVYRLVQPEEIGARRREILGVQALIAYWDTEGRGDFPESTIYEQAVACERRAELAEKAGGVYQGHYRPFIATEERQYEANLKAHPGYAHSQAIYEAVEWFKAHAEDICVWT